MNFISLFLLFTFLVSGSKAKDNVQSFNVGKFIVRVGGPSVKTFLQDGQGGEKLISEKRVSGLNLEYLDSLKSSKTPNGISLKWMQGGKSATLKVDSYSTLCVTSYFTADLTEETEDCYSYGDAVWYGGPERRVQEWPVQNAIINNEPYVSRETNNQAVLEPYWLSSAGEYIYVDPTTPLFFDSNNRKPNSLCLIGSLKDPYKIRETLEAQTTYCSSDNVVTAHTDALQTLLGLPQAHPSPYLMQHPIYCTWVRYGRDINERVIRSYTDELYDNGFLPGQIVVDDRWETCYGSLTFDTTRFPNITQLIDYMHSKGATASAWVHPFVGIGCEEIYEQFKDEGRLVKNEEGNVATVWWNGAGAVIDITNKTTKDWYIGRLKQLKESSGLDGLKLDAGESSWLPQLPEITGDPYLYPDSFVRNFVEAAHELGSNLEIRVGRSTQDIPVYIRMIDKDTRWGWDNGLHSIITTSFQMGLAGYPFILPDIIGGNQYGETITKELFIRWLQANALLPALQFSVVPWDFDNETVEISKNILQLRRNYTEELFEAANLTLTDGRPLVAPIWWYAPNDTEAFTINDEYMVGEKLLVAPVIKEGDLYRDIYLPSGNWTDTNHGNIIEGPAWIRYASAPLDTLPLFRKN